MSSVFVEFRGIKKDVSYENKRQNEYKLNDTKIIKTRCMKEHLIVI